MDPKFFKTQKDLRKWFEKNSNKESELIVGFYKVSSGKSSITWPQSVYEAICFGWIDGVRKSIDKESYMIRFTPRKTGSIWSKINIEKAEELIKNKLMKPEGLNAYILRKDSKSKIYAYEQKDVALNKDFEKIFKANKKAWEYFQSQPPSYQKQTIWGIINAKQESTKIKRLNELIADSEAGVHIKRLRWNSR